MAPSSPAAAADGLTITATTTYTIDSPAGVVRTQLELSFENVVAPVTEGATIRSTFFTGVDFGIHGDATVARRPVGRRARWPSATSPVDAEIQVLSITFPDQLDYGERHRRARHLGPARPAAPLGRAVADQRGLRRLRRLRLRRPRAGRRCASSPPSTSRSASRPSTRADVARNRSCRPTASSTSGRSRPSPSRASFGPVVISTNDAALTETVLDVEGREVVVQAWPDDPEWTAFMGGQVGDRPDRSRAADRVPRPRRPSRSSSARASSRSSRASPGGSTRTRA